MICNRCEYTIQELENWVMIPDSDSYENEINMIYYCEDCSEFV